MDRIYHHYKKWEDHKAGFYDSPNNSDENIEKVIQHFNNSSFVKKYMKKVCDLWVNSCEHNLSNISMNRVAWIGQASVCIRYGIPSKTTMYAWKHLPSEVRKRSNNIAKKIIKEWEQKKTLEIMSRNGKEKGMKKESQMKLRFN